MAVSKSRKSARKSSKRPATRSGNPAVREAAARQAASVPVQRSESAGGLFGLFGERRRQLDAQRVRRAGHDAAPAIEELLDFPGSLDELEDTLCSRMGKLLSTENPLDKTQRPTDFDPLTAYGPDHLLDALTSALIARASSGSAASRQEQEGLWRLLVAAARIHTHPVPENLVRAVEQLGARLSLTDPRSLACEPQGTAHWCRDAYGSRFAITAPFPATKDGPERWYLWDIDVCATDAFTVASGYHPSPDAALTAWRHTAGPEATEGAAFTPVNDPHFAARLLPALPDFLHPGGESEAQYAEFHRSRRLAQQLRDSSALDGRSTGTPRQKTEHVSQESWIAAFSAWRTEHRPGQQAVPEDFPLEEGEEPLTEQDLYKELASSWRMEDFPELSYACSPHRISAVTDHILDFYNDSFSPVLLRLIPDLAAWLTQRADLPSALAERSRARADTALHHKQADSQNRTNPLTLVTE